MKILFPIINKIPPGLTAFFSARKLVIPKNILLGFFFVLATRYLAERDIFADQLFSIVYSLFALYSMLVLNYREYLEYRLGVWKEFTNGLADAKKLETVRNLILPEDFSDEFFEAVAKTSFAEEVGGDFYNYLKDKKGNYWFAIGDSSGHDFNSHLFSMMILTQMNYCVNVYDNPDEIIDRINLNLESRSEKKNKESKSTYASFIIFKSDPAGNFIHSGSHPNFVLYRATENRIEIVETKGIFIGTDINFREATENQGTFQLKAGDILFSFTDGVFEEKNRSGRFYGEQIYKFLESAPKENLNTLAEKLFQSVRDFSGGHITDDMTFLAIRKK